MLKKRSLETKEKDIFRLPETETKKKVDALRANTQRLTFGEGYFESMGCEFGDGREFEFVKTSERGPLIIFYHPSKFTFVFVMHTAEMHLFDNNVHVKDFYFDPICEIEIFLGLDQVKDTFIQYLLKMLKTHVKTRPDANTVLCGPYRIKKYIRPKDGARYSNGDPTALICLKSSGRDEGVSTKIPFELFCA